MANPEQGQGDSRSLSEKVERWVASEGYPLEFSTAAEFQQCGFRVLQGHYVTDLRSGAQREIDVLAHMTLYDDKNITRVYHVVECKWSRDKPWVIFTSNSHRMMPSACINQSIGSKAGAAILWAIAGDPQMKNLDYFAVPKNAGFAGRQAFTKGQDLVYSALQSVTSAAVAVARKYDAHLRYPSDSLRYAVLAFPTVVVDGELFEGHFDPAVGTVQVKAADRLRLHWRGSEAWPLIATIDVVRASALPDFVAHRATETHELLTRVRTSLHELHASFSQRDRKLFTVTEGTRGTTGAPPLLFELEQEWSESANKPTKLGPSESVDPTDRPE